MKIPVNQLSRPSEADSIKEMLLEHYSLHGFPSGTTEAVVRNDISHFIRGRIKQLTSMDPYYLDDAKRMELRMVGGAANLLGIRSTFLGDVPPTEKELIFLKDIEGGPMPESIEEFEKYLVQHGLIKKEVLSPRVRMRIMRAIMSHYMSDADSFFRALTSPVIQNVLSGDEFFFIEKHVSPEMRRQLLERFRENYGKQKLPQAIGMILMQDAILSEDEQLATMIFDAYPSANTVNVILKISGIKGEDFILRLASQFVQRLSPEENSKVNWRLVFQKITVPSEYFAPLANRIPEGLNTADAWDAIIDATIAQENQGYIQIIRGIIPPYGLSVAAFTKLMRAAREE